MQPSSRGEDLALPWFLDTRHAPPSVRTEREECAEQGIHVTKFMKGFYRRKLPEPRSEVPSRSHRPLRSTETNGRRNWNAESAGDDSDSDRRGLRVYSSGQPDEAVIERTRRDQTNVMGSRLRYFAGQTGKVGASQPVDAQHEKDDRSKFREFVIVNEGLVHSKRASGILGTDWSKASNTLHSLGALDNFMHLDGGKPRIQPKTMVNKNQSQILLR